MTPLDWSVLSFASEVRLATSRQLMRQFWTPREIDPSRARLGRDVLQRLAEWRVLDRLPRAIGGARAGSDGHIYSVGLAGSKMLVGRGLQVRRSGVPGDRHIRHVLAITEAVVSLHEAHRDGELDLLEVQTEPRCWREFLTGFASRMIVKPDLFIRIGVGALEDRYFIEIDMATEASGTIDAKAQRYFKHLRSGTEQAEHSVYPGVLWAVPDERRAKQLQAMLGRHRSGITRMFSVCLQRDLVRYLAAEARS
ncbi:MAG TPA: replication-relaxation family protein [Solirubrobacteraceae bacterium]|nr:replication-relaxation family protein [Solirubrobacteraceae bacterium]